LESLFVQVLEAGNMLLLDHAVLAKHLSITSI